jgi:putative acetyltransferase
MQIRASRSEDAVEILDVHELAFGRPDEARLFAALDTADAVAASIVAVVDGRIVGHVLFSPVEIVGMDSSRSIRAVGLAPLAVRPNQQGRGIGSRLVPEGLAACRAAGLDAVVVLGDPAFYGRFGFRPASEYGLGNDYGADDEFMVVALRPGALAGVRGVVRYRPEFGQLGV